MMAAWPQMSVRQKTLKKYLWIYENKRKLSRRQKKITVHIIKTFLVSEWIDSHGRMTQGTE